VKKNAVHLILVCLVLSVWAGCDSTQGLDRDIDATPADSIPVANDSASLVPWSVLSGKLAHIGSARTFNNETPFDSLVIIDVASREVRTLIKGSTRLSDVTWSPDRRQIAVRFSPSAPDTGAYGIQIVDVATGAVVRRLEGAFSGRWSTDGRFAYIRIGSTDSLFIDGRFAASGQQMRALDWSKDGSYLLVTGFPPPARGYYPPIRIYKVTLPDTVMLDHIELPPFGQSFGSIRLSPDGHKLAYSTRDNGLDAKIWVADANGASPQLVATVHNLSGLDWSPDGSAVIFSHTSFADPSPTPFSYGVKLVRLSDRGMQHVLPGSSSGVAWTR
jgi:WD40 repeat protein